jgi:hypothetical protein
MATSDTDEIQEAADLWIVDRKRQQKEQILNVNQIAAVLRHHLLLQMMILDILMEGLEIF